VKEDAEKYERKWKAVVEDEKVLVCVSTLMNTISHSTGLLADVKQPNEVSPAKLLAQVANGWHR
jgi:hypothetical protein